jgi:hypothetical protein
MSDTENPITELQDAIICPHCQEPVLIEQINCSIFRHGVMKHSMKQMNPHASKNECDYLFSNSLIFGCGKPFKIIKDGEKIIIEVCDYI